MSKACFALAVAFALAACDDPPVAPPIPEMPSYAVDVQPIFAANCVRCHGANGMLNDGLNADGTPSSVGAPGTCYLSMYDDQGDCSDAGILARACKRGAHYCAMPMGDPPTSLIEYFVVILSQAEGGMPPLPLPALAARDKEVIRRWLLNPIP
jgi:hypothetical protein